MIKNKSAIWIFKEAPPELFISPFTIGYRQEAPLGLKAGSSADFSFNCTVITWQFTPASRFVLLSLQIGPMDVKIEAGWKSILQEEFNKPYFADIAHFLKTEKSQGKTIFPPGPLIFNAFDKTPFADLKVVLLGQDPYHGPGQAMGLSFSVPDGIKPPPSLVNIFKELHRDVGIPIPSTGNLTKWAERGVLLLNASLTVRVNEPNSHAKVGWHNFTDAVIQKISMYKKNVVFLLWGNFAKQKEVFIDGSKHLVLQSAHPSPFSADKFFGCGHFCKANNYLVRHGIEPINWSLD